MRTRTFVRTQAESYLTAAEVAAALREALDADGLVEIHDQVGSSGGLAFTLQVCGHGVIARAADGRHLNTFVDILIGIQHAFSLLDRAAPEQPAPRPTSRRSTRQAATGESR